MCNITKVIARDNGNYDVITNTTFQCSNISPESLAKIQHYLEHPRNPCLRRKLRLPSMNRRKGQMFIQLDDDCYFPFTLANFRQEYNHKIYMLKAKVDCYEKNKTYCSWQNHRMVEVKITAAVYKRALQQYRGLKLNPRALTDRKIVIALKRSLPYEFGHKWQAMNNENVTEPVMQY